ncbi:MAG: PEP-CTERM sorting domain-containing protein [Kiritimatiellae bacterium]|nr:PEP-CTERM sorting domain-containing protein [Kiritimatiellia bacterium]
MKKMMIVLAAVLVASVSQAANVVWSTGNLFTPTSAEDGAFTTTKITKDNGTWSAVVSFFLDDKGKQGEAISGIGNTSSDSVSLAKLGKTTSEYDFAASTTYWISAEITGKTTDGIDCTMSVAAYSFTTKGTGNTTVSLADHLPAAWTVSGGSGGGGDDPIIPDIPEPTSMALLALGAAAFGLRRKVR